MSRFLFHIICRDQVKNVPEQIEKYKKKKYYLHATELLVSTGIYIGQFQKISIPNHGRLPCFNPPPPGFGNSRMRYPPCPQNSIIVNPPYPSEFPLFLEAHFRLGNAYWTNEHEFMPPQGCDLAAPGDKLEAFLFNDKKTYHEWPGCAKSFLSLNLL